MASKKLGSKKKKSIKVKREIQPEEMVRIYKRIHSYLSRRLRESKKANNVAKGKDKKARIKYIEALKDLEAYERILGVCQSLTADIDNLKDILDLLNDASMTFASPDVITKGKPN